MNEKFIEFLEHRIEALEKRNLHLENGKKIIDALMEKIEALEEQNKVLKSRIKFNKNTPKTN